MTPRSRLPSSTSRDAVTTAPSTQPPDTDPATSPSSLTALVAPGSRGAEPSSATTRATATRCPSARQRSLSSNTSFLLPRSRRLLHGSLSAHRDTRCAAVRSGAPLRSCPLSSPRRDALAGHDPRQVLQRRQVVPLDELVNMREGGRHSTRQ